MKKEDLKNVVQQAVSEVLKEVITAPVQKDPALMSQDEKKQALLKARQQAGISDPTEPIDLIKKEGTQKLREMPRPAILYKLADDWDTKYAAAATNPSSDHPKWYTSASRKRWMDGIIEYLMEFGEADVTTIASEKFNVPQPMLSDYQRELSKVGVLVPAGIRGKDTAAADIVPQFMRVKTDDAGNEVPDLPTKLSNWGSTGNAQKDSEDLFIGSGFDDNFGDEETPGDSLAYMMNKGWEPEDHELGQKDNTSPSGDISSKDMDVLMQYDDLIHKLASIKAAIKKLSSPSGSTGGLNELSGDESADSASLANLKALYERKKDELKALIAAYKPLITAHRDVAKNLQDIKAGIAHKSPDSDVNEEDDLNEEEIDEDIVLYERMQKLANIKK